MVGERDKMDRYNENIEHRENIFLCVKVNEFTSQRFRSFEPPYGVEQLNGSTLI